MILHDKDRAAVIEAEANPEVLERVLALLSAGESDKFAAHLTSHADNTGALPSDRTRATRLSSARLSQVTRLRRA